MLISRRHLPPAILLLALVAMLASCSVEKHLQPGETVVYSNRVTIDMNDGTNVPKEVTQAAAKKINFIRQRPNRRVLGLDRLPMHVYCLSSPNDSNWLNRTLRNIGEAPAVFNSVEASRSTRQLETMMKQKGCFNTTADYDTIPVKSHNIVVEYHIHASPRYRIDELIYHSGNHEIDSLLQHYKEKSMLRVGDYYDQNLLGEERSRIANLLLEEGYYMANEELIQYNIDTTYSDNLLSIELIMDDPVVPSTNGATTLRLQKYFFYNISINDNAVNSNIIRRSINIMPGQTYQPSAISKSYNSLLNLHNFNFIDIRLQEDSNSSDLARLLDVNIHLRNNLQRKISLSLEISNASPITKQKDGNFLTNGNFGLETVIGYQNLNLFGGAEELKIEINGLIELPKSIFGKRNDNIAKGFSALEYGFNAMLDIPLFLIPFGNHVSRLHTLPHTILTASSSYQYRSYLERLQLSTSFGYSWNINNRSQHQLLPIEVTFVKIFNLDQDYILRILDQMEGINLHLLNQYDDHFIVGCRYDYVFNTQKIDNRTNFSYVHATAETAGNLLAAFATANHDSNPITGQYELLNIPYSQYVRFSAEYKRYIYHGGKNALVLRVLAGFGIPYGNSVAMPYEKSFFASGPTTIRAWQMRHLGPGSYKDYEGFNIERMGDLLFVGNIEERFPIVAFGGSVALEGAIFTDFGNIWMAKGDSGYGNGTFDIRRLPQDIALGAGLGLRMKISFITLRCDFALPIHDPGDIVSPWIFRHWNIARTVANFGINYPF